MSGCDLAAKMQTGVDLGSVTQWLFGAGLTTLNNMEQRGRLMTIPTQPLSLNTFLVGPLRQDTMSVVILFLNMDETVVDVLKKTASITS